MLTVYAKGWIRKLAIRLSHVTDSFYMSEGQDTGWAGAAGYRRGTGPGPGQGRSMPAWRMVRARNCRVVLVETAYPYHVVDRQVLMVYLRTIYYRLSAKTSEYGEYSSYTYSSVAVLYINIS